MLNQKHIKRTSKGAFYFYRFFFNDKMVIIGDETMPHITSNGICCGCKYSSEAFFCKACGKKHECGEDMILPIVNSPRTGVCAYTG